MKTNNLQLKEHMFAEFKEQHIQLMAQLEVSQRVLQEKIGALVAQAMSTDAIGKLVKECPSNGVHR